MQKVNQAHHEVRDRKKTTHEKDLQNLKNKTNEQINDMLQERDALYWLVLAGHQGSKSLGRIN